MNHNIIILDSEGEPASTPDQTQRKWKRSMPCECFTNTRTWKIPSSTISKR